MTKEKPGLKGLKPYAEQTLFRDWGVSPLMREQLDRRIRREAKARPQSEASTRTRAWRGFMTVAAAAAVLMIGQAALGPMQRPPQPAAQAVKPSSAQLPPPLVPQTAPRPDALKLAVPQVTQVTSITANSYVLTAKVADAQGVAVTTYDQAGSTLAAGVEAAPGRKIILNAELNLGATDAAKAMGDLQNMTAASGGYVVEATLTQGEDGSKAGRLVLRVPAGQYTGALERVRQAGEVKLERQYTQDVTDQFTDTETRAKILKEHEQKLEQLSLQAATFDNWLQLAKQINETRAQIESLEGSLKKLTNQVDYATLTITLTQPAPGQAPAVKSDPGLWQQLGKAFGSSVGLLGQGGRQFLLAAAASLPFLVPLALLATLVAIIIRRRRSRSE